MIPGTIDIAGLLHESFTWELQWDRLAPDEVVLRQPDGLFSEGEIREESLLSSWRAPNWVIEGDRIRQVRSRAAERERRRKRILRECGALDPWMMIQNPPVSILGFGDWRWVDYTLRTTLSGGVDGPTGVAFRYQDGRHYYALTIQQGVGLSVVRRTQDAHEVLGRVPLPGGTEAYPVYARVEGSQIEGGIVDGPFVHVLDETYAYGKAALVCEGESIYGPLHVEGQRVVEASQPLPEAPEMALLAHDDLDVPLRQGRILLLDLDGNGTPELVSYDAETNTFHAQHLAHGALWTLGPYAHRLSQGGDVPLQAFDIAGNGRLELVFCADFKVRIHDALTGEELATAPAPRANPFREFTDYPHERLLADALCPLRTALGQPPGFYVKDRYWNLWAYDCHLELLWHRALNTGHLPLPLQLRAGEPESLFASRSMLSPGGKTMWDLVLPDHADNIGFFALRATPRLYIAAGEEGLLAVDPLSGEIETQHRWGHVQRYAVGKFLPGQAGYQLLTVTLWREPGIAVLFDDQLDAIGRWVEMCRDLRSHPLPWGTTGADLVVNRTGILDPLTGRVVRPLPEACGRVRWLSVHDLPTYGPGCLLVVVEDSWQIWGPGANVPPVVPRARPNALNPTSYLPSLAL
jgi:hypothetical protein